jgi:hypothetical protein
MHIIRLFFFKRTPEITVNLIELIEEKDNLRQSFGDFRGSEIQYTPIIEKDDSKYKFEAIMKGSNGNVKIEGQIELEKNTVFTNWIITKYKIIPVPSVSTR